jgi:hypothetical protein
MGERVVIDPQRMTEPVEAVPLEYGHGGRAADGWRVARETIRTAGRSAWAGARAARAAAAREGDQMARDISARLVPALGGWRQVMFAFGLAFVLGGVGGLLGHPLWAVSMWIGGLLIGFSFRIPRWKD